MNSDIFVNECVSEEMDIKKHVESDYWSWFSVIQDVTNTTLYFYFSGKKIM